VGGDAAIFVMVLSTWRMPAMTISTARMGYACLSRTLEHV
jgi:hypothetical protein